GRKRSRRGARLFRAHGRPPQGFASSLCRAGGTWITCRRSRSGAGAEHLGGFVQEVELLLEVRAHEAFVEVMLQRLQLVGRERTLARERQQPRGVAAIQVVVFSGHGTPRRRTRSARGTCAARCARGAGSPSNWRTLCPR